MSAPAAPMLDKRAVRAAFDRAAAGYDAAAVLQREIGERLLARLDYVRLAPQRVLDLGCGTGFALPALARRYRDATLLGLDVAPAMTRAARGRCQPRWPFGLGARFSRCRFVTADAEALPVADRSVDLVFSNLALQWCDPQRVFAECRRVLRPGGLLLFASFGPDTLKELRAAWTAVDRETHVHAFTDMHDLGDALLQSGLADPVMDMEPLTLTYADVGAVLRDLKGVGAHNLAAGRPATLTGKSRFARFQAAYEQFRRADGRIPATYEVVYGHAWSLDARGEESRGEGQGARGEGWKPVSIVRRR